GTRESAIMVAEGEKQAAVLEAEGERQATILRAEGDREAALLRAKGFASALEEIYKVAQQVDSKTLTLQYLDALKELGAGASTKFVIPTELLNLARPLTAYTGEAYAELRGKE
ncbi:MAG TPA: SPFH/Band 7/PHB domain protein, partial [Anaerolineae bacterium]|nr:SPFH/Band 7/PHB domain protein [Anaerolineae bacterium]